MVPVVATSVSHNASTRIAAWEAERLAATAKQTGMFGTIEPELLQTAPRQVRQRNQFREAQLTFAALALASTLGMLYTAYIQPIPLHIWMLLPICTLLPPALRVSIAGSDNELLPAQYLAFGTATRALVTSEDNTTPHKLPVEKYSIVFRYKYESADGRVHTDHLTVPRSRAWHLGLCEGATFTVLYNPKHPEAHTPYFQITDAELVGAMGAKVSPP
ncbi:MAG: hypothetical protein H7Y38_15910 [Armatimonadetes bacterium]|nr:hypothetical protein [Armatimonadota bacterium]